MSDWPSVIVARAFRYYGHFQGDAILYRTKDELAAYHRRDPLTQLRTRVIERGLLGAEDLDRGGLRRRAARPDLHGDQRRPPYPEPLLPTDNRRSRDDRRGIEPGRGM
jgi:pyruvate dehydrogenase E1 component alpha subunit